MVFQDRDQEMADALSPRKGQPRRRPKKDRPDEPAAHLPGGLREDKLSPDAAAAAEATPPPGHGLGPQDTPVGDVTAAGGPHPEDDAAQVAEPHRPPPEPPPHGPVAAP